MFPGSLKCFLLQLRDFTSSSDDYSLADAIEDLTELFDLIVGLDTTSALFDDVELLNQVVEWVNEIGVFVGGLLEGDDLENLGA